MNDLHTRVYYTSFLSTKKNVRFSWRRVKYIILLIWLDTYICLRQEGVSTTWQRDAENFCLGRILLFRIVCLDCKVIRNNRFATFRTTELSDKTVSFNGTISTSRNLLSFIVFILPFVYNEWLFQNIDFACYMRIQFISF